MLLYSTGWMCCVKLKEHKGKCTFDDTMLKRKNSRIHFFCLFSQKTVCFSSDAGVGNSPDASFLNRIKCNFPNHIFFNP